MKTLERDTRYANQAVESVKSGDLNQFTYAVSSAFRSSRGVETLLTALSKEVSP